MQGQTRCCHGYVLGRRVVFLENIKLFFFSDLHNHISACPASESGVFKDIWHIQELGAAKSVQK